MSLLKRLPSLSSLHWKLVVSYVGVTLLTLLTLEAGIILVLNWFGAQVINTWVAQSTLAQARRWAELAAEPMEAGAPDRLAQVLGQQEEVVIGFTLIGDGGPGGDATRWISPVWVVVGPQGHVVTSSQPGHYPTDTPFAEPGLPGAERLVAEALANGAAGSHLAEEVNVVAVATPITNAKGDLLGALYRRQPLLDTTGQSLSNLVESLLVTTLVLLPCMIPLGLTFGFVTATGFSRRLRHLSEASSALAHGDLGCRVQDTSRDEIGQLARQFNAMAKQIEADTTQLRDLAESNAQLARQAQRLAALEERHRLARDLHDGVKQHLFGANLATSAALNLLDDNPEAARVRLREAQEHSRQAQVEMQALLNELRPAGLDERGLAAALRDYTTTFEQRHGIKTHWHTDVAAGFSLPITHEQALFRIAQEALTNIVRHAQATQIAIELQATPEAVELRIADNGQGFNPASIGSRKTMGLQGMRERLMDLGGTLTIETSSTAGTRILARLPCPPQSREKAADV